MKITQTFVTLIAGLCASTAVIAASATVRSADLEGIGKKFRATFPSTPLGEVQLSEIPGVYEIYTGGRLLYYAPAENAVLFGEIYSANGISFTQAKLDARAQKRIGAIDKTTALVVGEGPTDLIAIVDADCPHCRHAINWLSEKKIPGVRTLVYFMPMRGRPAAEARVTQALCAPPELREEALRQVFNPDPNQSGPGLTCPEADAALKAQAKVVEEVGVSATPFFFVKGQAITGFDRERLAALLIDHKE